jgi:hypothetical protein
MKAKPVLLVIGTLIIGFVLGMLTSAQIRLHKLSPVKVFFSEDRFRDGFYKAIQPDEKQKAKIDLILDKYAKINSGLQDNFRKEMDLNMTEFRKEIDSNLTKEQLARLKEMDERRHQMVRQNMRNYPGDSIGSRGSRRGNPNWERRQDGIPPSHRSGSTADSLSSSNHK